MSDPPPPRPVITLQGALLGARIAAPSTLGVVAFAVAFGAASVQKGLTLWESVVMSLILTAGASQMLSLELWRDTWTLGGLLTIAAVTATVNARFLLMGASLQPWLGRAPIPFQALSLFFLFEASWLAAEKHRAEGGQDFGVFLGAGLLSWSVWWLATIPGYLAGTLVTDPKRLALDLVMPFFFAALAVPLWRGLGRSGLPWAVAAGVGLITEALVPGYLFIITGSLAGALTGALSHGRR
ncbi:AzlC family ABC transporter permease [uncultured Enterovirga sp.]|uniref:AzlC family ABC transporter permease n=1 Tax=uncultured Enterovirga sp. TaxID=2026352 RepID=UPI0035CAE386